MKPYSIITLFFQKFIWIPTRLCLLIFGRVTIDGLDNMRGVRGPIIFVCNHSSEIDPFIVPASLPFFSEFSPLFYIVREKSFYESNGWRKHLFNDWFIKMWGGYRAAVGLRDYEKSLAQHVEILQDGGSFCVFPEGGITKNGEIQSAKGGISFLAHSAPCHIVPVGISRVWRMSPLDFFLGKRRITVRFGKPIKPEELYNKITQPNIPHTPGESVWKKEADYIMKKVGELLEN